jgi:hypothetical protein
MKKQTAAEWLVEHFKKLQSKGEKMSWTQIIQIVELTKEMDKQQTIDAYLQGCEKGEMFNNENRAFSTDAEQYYNETFNNEENSSNTTN